MLAKEHMAFGFVTSTTMTVAAYNPTSPVFSYPIVFVSSAILGSILTDIDEPNSKIGQLFHPLSCVIKKACGHRTVVHDFGIWMILFLLSIFTKNPIIIGILFGYLSHIYLDGLTKQGVLYFGKSIHFIPSRFCVYASGIKAKIYTYSLCIGIVYFSNLILKIFHISMEDKLGIFIQDVLLSFF